MRRHHLARIFAAVALAAAAHGDAAGADPAVRRKAGACAAFVRRVVQADRAGIARPDLYEGLSGWIAMKGGLDPDDVDALAVSSSPDAPACDAFALAPEPLRALAAAVAGVPAEKLRSSAELCLAGLRLLDEAEQGSPREVALRALVSAQARTVGRLLGYLSRELKPGPGAVAARVQALRDGAAGDLRGAALGAALSACEPVGVDVAQLRRAHEEP